MLNTLLIYVSTCRDDSNDFRKSRVAQQRDEALKRAEERRREELVKFKAEFKREMASKRCVCLPLIVHFYVSPD